MSPHMKAVKQQASIIVADVYLNTSQVRTSTPESLHILLEPIFYGLKLKFKG